MATQTRPVSAQFRLGDYVRLARRRWWAILLGLLVGLSAAYAYSSTRTAEYTSTASVQVLAIEGTDTGAVANGRTSGALNLDTEAQLVKSALVQEDAAKLLRTSIPPEELGKAVTVTVPANTSVLDIHFRADNPESAAQGAHAFAEAYLSAREDTAKNDIAAQVTAIQTQIKGLTAQLRTLTSSSAALPADSPERAYALAQINIINDQISTLNSRLVPLQTSQIQPGRIITDAQVPPDPSGPLSVLPWASGLLLGLLIGLLLAFALERGDKRVRRAVDIERELDVPVLVEVPAGSRADFSVVQSTHSRQGNAFSELRNVLVSLVSDREQIILVAGASDGPAGSIVAANLAVSLARMNLDTVLICADPASSGRQILDLDPTAPGLSELLHGDVNVAGLEQRPGTGSGLRVIPPGAEAELTSEAVQVFLTEQAIRQFRHSARFVVIDAPPMSSGSQAQTLARLAHVTVLVVELGVTRHDQVLRGARLIDLVGTRSIGMVAMPRVPVRREKRRTPTAEPVHHADPGYGPSDPANADHRLADEAVTDWHGSSRADRGRYRLDAAEDRYGAGTDGRAGGGRSAAGERAGASRDSGWTSGGMDTRSAGGSAHDAAGAGHPASASANRRTNGRNNGAAMGGMGDYGPGGDDPAVEAATDEPTRRIARPITE